MAPPTFKDANFPLSDGRTYHVGTKYGEVANRIITVGDAYRARNIASHLDPIPKPYEFTSKRQFFTITGRFKGVPVSIVAIGMGLAVTDMFIRECRAVVSGEMVVIRFGSCGSVDRTRGQIGQIVVADASVCVSRNHDYFFGHVPSFVPPAAPLGAPYVFSKSVPADPTLASLLESRLSAVLGPESVCRGLNASTDYFYPSQGRNDPHFDDSNTSLIDDLCKQYPNMLFFEMENYLLFHMALCSQRRTIKGPQESHDGVSSSFPQGNLRAAAAAMVFAQRASNGFVTPGM
ncbi:purine and uridine phosphorylase [Gonapodya prolifera JEL478]|uniref:Purine and uridine phosphorylase n=1 Tax=Gonapodya prolifera (strain JEL478) TaxID=1344416 RepID=A0A139AS93_GONPJ|nr:purine and uridine phosphorylase [Gonapodya prolifera JEL478]|eukprot:KXS19335.1 purine and uridine phosphorylase [Gonapodya prolifera JEL478]